MTGFEARLTQSIDRSKASISKILHKKSLTLPFLSKTSWSIKTRQPSARADIIKSNRLLLLWVIDLITLQNIICYDKVEGRKENHISPSNQINLFKSHHLSLLCTYPNSHFQFLILIIHQSSSNNQPQSQQFLPQIIQITLLQPS